LNIGHATAGQVFARWNSSSVSSRGAADDRFARIPLDLCALPTRLGIFEEPILDVTRKNSASIANVHVKHTTKRREDRPSHHIFEAN